MINTKDTSAMDRSSKEPSSISHHQKLRMAFQIEENVVLDAESKALALKELRETEENVKNGITALRKLLEGQCNIFIVIFFWTKKKKEKLITSGFVSLSIFHLFHFPPFRACYHFEKKDLFHQFFI